MNRISDADHDRSDCARAIRALLRQPLIDDSAGEVYRLVIRHVACSRDWFEDKCGWRVVVDHGRDFVRLRKNVGTSDLPRPAMTGRTTPRPFDRSRYILFAVAAAALAGFTRPQVSLRDLANRVRELTEEDTELATYDADVGKDRSALVDALGLLTELGVLELVDRRGDYERTATANALYNINERRLAQLIAAPNPPSTCGTLAAMCAEDRYVTPDAVDPDADGGQPQWISADRRRTTSRHGVMRRLLDDPVLFTDDLDREERQYLTATVGPITSWLDQAGLTLERRAEGWCAVDSTQDATDMTFPNPAAIVDQASLLLINALAESRDAHAEYWVPTERVLTEIETLLAATGSWAKTYRSEGGTALLAERVAEQLEACGIVSRKWDGIVLRPVAGRFRDVERHEDGRTGERA